MSQQVVCSLTGGEFELDSPAAFVHEYLATRDGEARGLALKRMFSKPIFLGGTTTEFEGHSLADLAADPSEAARELIDQRYLVFGNTLIRNGFPVEGLTIIRSLYTMMRKWETGTRTRWAKGTGLFFLSQAHLATGSRLDGELAMWLAFLEDVWGKFQAGAPARSLPAYKFLSGQMGLATERVEEFADALETTVRSREVWDPGEPERSYLLTICHGRFWMRERAPVTFIPEVARFMWERTGQIKDSSYEKGLALELLMAYQFEAAGGFRVFLRPKGSDAENDLIVLNLNDSKPLSMLGDYILVSCKNTSDRPGSEVIHVLRTRMADAKCNCGMIVTPGGVSGQGSPDDLRASVRAIVKADNPILVLSSPELRQLCKGRDELQALLVSGYIGSLFGLYKRSDV